MARQRYRAAQWAVLIDEWNASGLDLPEFCRRRGLSRGTMRGWVYKPALKRAIESARLDGQITAAKSSHEVAPRSRRLRSCRSASPRSLPRRPSRRAAPRYQGITWAV